MELLQTLHQLSQDPDYSELSSFPGVVVDLKYAGDDNFMSKNVYREFNRAFLHRRAADMLRKASEILRRERPGHKLLVLDALRPRSVQRLLWAHVEGTDQEAYVANPDRGSMHNYGCAVDLTLIDEKGAWLDMGTGFDAFLPLSQPKLEEHYLATGELTRGQLENRLVLRRAMTGAGFHQLPHEWWHYDAFPGDEVRKNFRIIE